MAIKISKDFNIFKCIIYDSIYIFKYIIYDSTDVILLEERYMAIR